MWITGVLLGWGCIMLASGCMAGSDAQFLTDVFTHSKSYRQQVELKGKWEFRRDKENQGKSLGWQEGKGKFTQSMSIPGVPQAQGLGEPSESMKNRLDEPFWVRRKFAMPKVEPGKRIWLRIGGILPAAEVYINGSYIGYTQSSRTQQRVDVTDAVKLGSENQIAIKVCDWPKVKLEGIWEMAEIQRIWTGVYGNVRLEITDPVSIVDVYAKPNLAAKSVNVSLQLTAPAAEPVKVNLIVQDGSRKMGSAEVTIPKGEVKAATDVKLPEFTTWSPDHPKLYELVAAAAFDKVGVRFGMREIASIGKKFYLNGKPVYLRTFGDDQLYAHTLCPPADKDDYIPMLKRARAFGLNAAKSCEEIFSQGYIEAADEAGIMIIQEMPFGLSGEVRVNQHKLDKPWRDYYTQELEGLVRESRNNASVIAYSMCSEVPLDDGTQEAFDLFARDLPSKAKHLAPTAMVIDNTGWNGGQVRDKGVRFTDFYAVIIPTWCKEALNETPVTADGKHPIMLHEYNWWSCYPDPKTRPNYANTPLIPWWLDLLEKTAKENGQLELVPTYVKNSAWLQDICRKDGLEYARRCPNVEGYILWLITDFGQYTEGLFDDFWQPKSNTSAVDFLKSTADTVILLAKEGNRCFETGKTLNIPLAISHYGEADLAGSVIKWRVESGERRVSQQGEIKVGTLTQGELTQTGEAKINLPNAKRGYKFELEVALYHDGKLVNTNNWSFWGMPEVGNALEAPKNGVLVRTNYKLRAPISADTKLVIADRADQALADYVAGGGKCLLLSNGLPIEEPEAIYQGYTTFRTIPWNGGPGNMGTVINKHPALEVFPHEVACDFQFAWMISKAHPMNFGELRKYGIEPIIRFIDWYRINKNLTYIMEFNVGKGKVLITSLGIMPMLTERLEARYILNCLLEYAQGEDFAPKASVPSEDFVKLFSKPKK